MEKIGEDIWKLNVDSNVYFLNLKEKIVIDTGPEEYKDKVKDEIKRIIDLRKIEKVIFTHLHYDHIGNFDIFEKAEFFASEEEIKSFNDDKTGAILSPALAKKFNVRLKPLKQLDDFEIISSPGHTRGSICLFYIKEKILFSGDTLFYNGYGRLDLPMSVPEKMRETLKNLKKLNYKILAPGHDY